MQFADALLTRCERTENEAVDGCDSRIENVIDNVHSVHPVLVHSMIPEELHHDEELGQLRYLRQDDQADIQSLGWDVVL